MKLAKQPGIVRRPIEYLLMAVIVLLIVLLLWAVQSLEPEQPVADEPDGRTAVEVRDGTLREVGRLTDEDVAAENALIREYDEDEREAAYADAAADNLGGVYDETVY